MSHVGEEARFALARGCREIETVIWEKIGGNDGSLINEMQKRVGTLYLDFVWMKGATYMSTYKESCASPRWPSDRCLTMFWIIHVLFA